MSQTRYWVTGKATLALMAGLLAAPFAFLLDLGARFALVEWSCRHGHAVLWLVLVVTVVLAAAGGSFAWKSWQRLNSEPAEKEDAGAAQSTGHALHDRLRTDEGGPHGRSRFLALAGMAASAFFLAIILASVIPSLLLHPCM